MDSKSIRKSLNMSQSEFANAYGISIATVQNWDARSCMPAYLENIFSELISLREDNAELRKKVDY